MIICDQVITHLPTGTGDDTVPPGITGLDWCHLVSTESLLELEAFLTTNILTVQCPPTNVRTPILGSRSTYAGLSEQQRAAAIVAGAVPRRTPAVMTGSFDAQSTPPHFEP